MLEKYEKNIYQSIEIPTVKYTRLNYYYINLSAFGVSFYFKTMT